MDTQEPNRPAEPGADVERGVVGPKNYFQVIALTPDGKYNAVLFQSPTYRGLIADIIKGEVMADAERQIWSARYDKWHKAAIRARHVALLLAMFIIGVGVMDLIRAMLHG